MELPAVFKSAIATKTINLFPLVIIDGHIFLSTKQYSQLIEGINLDWLNLTIDPTVFHYKPILLYVPSIKESVDLETRNFKISNLSWGCHW